MVHENYINSTLTTRDETKRMENIAYSADALSDVDLFDTVFNFDLEPYVALNTIRAASKCTKKGQVKFPQFLGKTATINKNKREKLNYETAKFFEDTKKTPAKKCKF
jgi:hypothetical protein